MRAGRLVCLLIAGCVVCAEAGRQAGDVSATFRIGRKDFLEQDILCEIVKQHVRRRLRVDAQCSERFDRPHEEILAGRIDAYVEYLGTAYASILRQETSPDATQIHRTVESKYRSLGLLWLKDLGFETPFAIVVRSEEAKLKGVTKLSQAFRIRSEWRFGSGPAFQVRPDGLSGLFRKYALRLKGRPTTSTIDSMFRFLQVGVVDMIAANSTDPLVKDPSVIRLEDDLRYFPPYAAAIVLRKASSDRMPGLVDELNLLAGTISEAEIVRLQREVTLGRSSAEKAAADFLSQLPQGS